MSQARKIPMRKCIGCQEMKSKKEIAARHPDTGGRTCD